MQGIQESPIQAGKKTESEKQREEQRLISFEQEQKLENFQKKFQNQDINQSLFDLEQELQKSQNYMLNQINDNKVIMGELVKELEGIDGELKNYQAVLNSNQEKLLIQSNKLRNVNQQREVYETRQQNMLQLQDVLEMLLKPLELNQEETKILQNSVFTKQSIEQGEAIIQKFINYLKMTEVDTENLSILSEKQQEIVQILQKFQQKLFRSLEQDSKACLEEYEHNLEKNKFFIDSSVFKFRVEKKKKLFSFLTYLDKENGVEQLVSYFTDEYFNLMEGGMQNLEKRLEKQFGEGFQSMKGIGLVSGGLKVQKNIVQIGRFWGKIEEGLEDLFGNLYGVLEADCTFFLEFFSLEGSRKEFESEQLKEFIEYCYSGVKEKLSIYLQQKVKVSPVSVCVIYSSIQNLINLMEEGQDDIEEKIKSKDLAVAKQIYINICKELKTVFQGNFVGQFKQFKNYVEEFQVQKEFCAHLEPVRNFADFQEIIILYADSGSEVYGKYLNQGNNLILEWLKSLSKQKQSYENLIMVGNLYFLKRSLKSREEQFQQKNLGQNQNQGEKESESQKMVREERESIQNNVQKFQNLQKISQQIEEQYDYFQRSLIEQNFTSYVGKGDYDFSSQWVELQGKNLGNLEEEQVKGLLKGVQKNFLDFNLVVEQIESQLRKFILDRDNFIQIWESFCEFIVNVYARVEALSYQDKGVQLSVGFNEVKFVLNQILQKVKQ